MLRILALARRGELGERLFCYPVAGSSADMLPRLRDSRSRLRLLPIDSVWRAFGARPVYMVTARQFLNALSIDSVPHPMWRDYILCGHLIDRDLDGFALLLPHYYPDSIAGELPRFYREAMDLHDALPNDTADCERGTYRFYYYGK